MTKTTRKNRRLRREEICPCESGLAYGVCCYDKSFRWERNDKGRVVRTIPLHPLATDALKDELKRFEAIFTRKPGAKDRIFTTAVLTSEADLADFTEELLEEIDADPAFIYAARKTGWIVTEENRNLLTDADWDEWCAALDEYEQVANELKPPLEQAFDEEFQATMVEFVRLPYVLATFINRCGVNRKRNTEDPTRAEQRDFVFFCGAKSLKTLRAIQKLLLDNLGEDALSLTRTVYENYLHIIFALANPERLIDVVFARAGLSSGTYVYGTNKSGKVDRRIAVETKSGRSVRLNLTSSEMANASPFSDDATIHSSLYEFLSRYTHPNLSTIFHYVDHTGFHATGRAMVNEAFVLTVFVFTLVLDALLQMPHSAKRWRTDVHKFVVRTRDTLDRLLHVSRELGMSDMNVDLFRKRLRFVGEPWPPFSLTRD